MSPYELDDDERNTVYAEPEFLCKRCGAIDPWHVCEGYKCSARLGIVTGCGKIPVTATITGLAMSMAV